MATGARTIEIQGLDSNWDPLTETVTTTWTEQIQLQLLNLF